MLQVIDYIKKNGLEKLNEEFGIEIREYDDRVVLNYNQIESPKFNPIVRECRGLILSKPDYDILSITFNRFFNYGEDPNTTLYAMKDAVAYEKVDGSLLHVYNDGANWNVATRGTAYAEGETRLGDLTFRQVFELALGAPVNVVFSNADPDHVYVFELTSPYSRVVKQYPLGIYPLMVKNKKTLLEITDQATLKAIINALNFVEGTNPQIRYSMLFKFDSYDHILESMKLLDAFDEGYVCVLQNYPSPWRMKIKSPQYLAIAHLRGNGELSTKRVVALVFLQEHEEYLASFEEDRVIFQPYIDAYNRMIDEVHSVWEKVRGISDQKTFALQVKDLHCSGILFGLRQGKTLTQIFDKMFDTTKEKLINGYK